VFINSILYALLYCLQGSKKKGKVARRASQGAAHVNERGLMWRVLVPVSKVFDVLWTGLTQDLKILWTEISTNANEVLALDGQFLAGFSDGIVIRL
jgi:hypothetical protein